MNINTNQIRMMKHAIGLKQGRVKRHKYEAFRNYFTTHSKENEWEDLVVKGLATSRVHNSDGVVYFVSRKGMDLLEEITMVKITGRD